MSNFNRYIDFDAEKISEAELVELITYHDRRYWEDNETEISDERYDQLVLALKKLNPEHQLINRVNTPAVAGTGKVVHERPMLSLDKAYSLEEIINWAKKYIRHPDEVLLVQPKYDGISANFVNGILATRGDGNEGENISDKLPLIELETSGYTGILDRPVRGEIVIRDDDFKNLYCNIIKKGGGHYKNSRNAVAGIMGLKEISDMVRQHAKLTLVDYELYSWDVYFHELTIKWPEILAKVESLPYPTDGIVIKFADPAYRDSLGNTAHHPRGQIAFKFSGIRKESVLLDVEWSFGKNCLTPVALIEPVDIGGITIRHASLHNAQNIIDRDVHIGDTVIVERAGDVIPYIVKTIAGNERRPALISECPSCHTQLTRRGPELCCINPDCFETKVQRLTAAVRNIGIERLGEPNIRKMMLQLNVASLKDIFSLALSDILKLDGFKDKSASNLFNEINLARNVNDYQLIAALNIPNIGMNVAKSILKKYTLNELRNLDESELAGLNGIGPERAAALRNELESQAAILDELLACVELTQSKGNSQQKPKICFTGKMPLPREHYEELAKQRGYDPVDSVTKDLALLVAESINATGGKLDKAKKLNIKIIPLEQWLAQIESQLLNTSNFSESSHQQATGDMAQIETPKVTTAPDNQQNNPQMTFNF